MTNYKHPSKKASETVTFRLTAEEKACLGHLAELKNKSMTDLIRWLLSEEAGRTGLTDPTGSIGPTRQTRPTPSPTLEQSLKHSPSTKTFGDLVERFRNSFRDRAEGTRKELDDTLRFLVGVESDYPPLLPLNMPVRELTSSKLREVRRSMSLMDMRVAKKNLHLTYLRMMLHFAVKHSEELTINPASDLTSFTISELPKAWPGRQS